MRAFAILLALGLIAAAPALSQGDTVSVDQICTSRDSTFVSPCFPVRARLEPGGDNVAIWIWPVGTTRYLGYLGDRGSCALPQRLAAIMEKDRVVAYANIVVRPTAKERAGAMQFVCIASVSRITVREKRY